MNKMQLTKYQFELLTYIENRSPLVFDKRTISNDISISSQQISRDFGFLLEKKLVENVGQDKVGITAKGLKFLEPYRVKKAIILAAGFGSRMMPATSDRPKPMVTVNGRRIIETLLDALRAVDITDVTIVRGYAGQKFNELLDKYPYIKFIDNPNYSKFNNISSAVLIDQSFKDGAYLCESDLYITNPKVITKYQYESNILGSWSLETDDWSFKMDDSGYIKDYQQGNTYCWNYYGISYWNAKDCEKLNHDWLEVFKTDKGKDVFWEQVPLQLNKNNYQVGIRLCNKSDIMEIDNYYELAQLDKSYQ